MPCTRNDTLPLVLLLFLLATFSDAFYPLPKTRVSFTALPSSFLRRQSWRFPRTTSNAIETIHTYISSSASSSTTSGPEAVRSQPPSPSNNATHLQMISFYHFWSKIEDDKIRCVEELRDSIFESLSNTVPGVRGSLYISAKEGFNGQFAVPVDFVEDFASVFQAQLDLGQDQMNLGDIVPISTPTFQRLIVRTRDAILRDGLDLDLDWKEAGEELSPEAWDQELRGSGSSATEAKTPCILDCRNDYESDQGTFQNAVPLNTTTFSESWGALRQLCENVSNRDDPVYIFCTGGIRCVKVGAFMKQSLGFTNVRRLKHGIIGYQKWHEQEEDYQEASLWNGENFLFDKRRFAEGGEAKDRQDNE